MTRLLFALAAAAALTLPTTAGPIAPTPTSTPVPTEVKYVSSTIVGTRGVAAPRISPGVTQALGGQSAGEYRVTSTLSVSWDGNKITASTRYVGTRRIQEVFTNP